MCWIQFIISAVVIVLTGTRLTKYADMLGDKTRVGKAWIGMVMLGFVTSMPEAVTSLVSVISIHAEDLAVGNLLGSNNFNLMLIVIMDIVYRRGAITDAIRPDKSHMASAFFSGSMLFIVFVEIFLFKRGFSFYAGNFSVGWILIVSFYFGGMAYLAKISKVSVQTQSVRTDTEVSLTKIRINLFFSALIVVIGASFLASSADIIAMRTGLGRTFVGTIFLAVITSLPEMVVSISALRLGALDLAVGNIFGSNMINIFILSVCGLFSRGMPILSMVSSKHIFTAFLGTLLTGVIVVGIRIKNKKTVLGVGWDSVLMFLLFIAGFVVSYHDIFLK